MLRNGPIWNKMLILGIIGVLFITPFAAATTVFTNEESLEIEHFSVKYTYDLSPSDLVYNEILGYDVIRFDECDYLNEVGKPMLPIAHIRLALPSEMTAENIKIIDSKSVVLEKEFEIFPAQPPLITSQSINDISEIKSDDLVYQSSQQFPEKLVELTGQSDLAGQGIAEVAIYPVHYNALSNKVEVFTSISFSVEGSDGHVCGDYLPKTLSEKSKQKYEQRIKDMVVNPEKIKLTSNPVDMPQTTDLPSGGPYDHVIITRSNDVSYWQVLSNWHTKRGLKDTVVTTTYIYDNYGGADNQEEIRNFIIDAYNTWGTMYFLLCGEDGDIPFKDKSCQTDDNPDEYETVPSDQYYGDFDDDWEYEVFVGRVPARGSTEVPRFVDKVLTYEKNPPLTNYPLDICLLGMDLTTYSSHGELTRGEYLKEDIDDDFIPARFIVDKIYDTHPGNHEDAFIAALNDGQNLVNHNDHCNQYVMGTGDLNHGSYITRSDVDALTNTDRLCNIYSLGCWPNAMDYTDSIAEHFVYYNDDQAGVSFTGNTRSGWFYIGDYNSLSANLDYDWWKGIFTYNNYVLGDALAYTKDNNPTYPYIWKYCHWTLNLQGEPAMPLWTDTPLSFDITHSTSISTGSQQFTVHVEESGGGNIQNAYVCLMKGTDVYARGYTNSAGNAVLTINPTSGGSMDVTVTTQNFLPSETMVSVTDQAPYTPSNPDPYDGETGILLDQILSWTGGDPQGDSVSYDVYFGTTNPPGYVATVSVESFDPDITNLNTEHFWQIIADDGNGHTTDGPVWSFTTLSDNNMILENAEAYPGQIQAPVEVSGSWDQTITAYQIHVAYDTTYLDFSTVDFIGSIGEFADMGAWSFEPQPGLIVFGAMWLWGSEPAGTGLLGKILFNVSGSVPIDTVIPLNFTIYNTDPSFYTDVSGFNFFPDLIDGSLTISEFADTNPPAISNIQATPNPQDKDGSVTISCDVTDDSAVSQVNVIITGPPGYTPLNTSMTYDGGSSYSYSDSYSILGDYTYNIWAQDAHGNSGSSSVYGFTISDMTPPDITDMTPSTASTGDSFTFTADITDNVGVSNAFVEYWYGSGTHTNEEMQYSGGQYQKTITVDHTTELLYYIISAVDNYDNWDYTTTLDVFVYDNDVPSIDSVTGDISGETGQTTMVTVGFSDNIGVTEAILYYKSASAPGYSSKSILSGSAGIDIPADSIESWYYYVTVDDAAGNGPVGDPSVDGSSYYIISVTDSIAPVISSITGSTTGTTGETTTITTSFSDNIGVSEATLYYKSASAGGYSSTSILSGSADILLPIDSVEEWYYYVTVDDSAGNGPVGDPSVDGSMYYTISVSDNDAPQITDVDDFPDPQTVNFSHNITCTVTDNIGVGLVEVEITYPDLSVQTYPMAAVGGDTYKFELTYETPGNYTYVIYAEDTSANPQMSSEQEFTIEPGAFCGDANGDGIVNVGDAVYVISYVFKGGPAPVPYCRGDANGDGAVNVGDGVYIINYVFKGGPPPADICCP